MNAFNQIPHSQPDAVPGSYIPLIFVRSIYSPEARSDIRDKLANILTALEIGMPRLHTEITRAVAANNKRILKSYGKAGLHVDQLSVKNLYHFFEGRRSDDSRVQILDAFLQLYEEQPSASHLMV